MADTMDYLFGPLKEDYCIWFYGLSIFWFIYMIMLLVVAIYYGLTKKTGAIFWVNVIALLLGYFFFYFQNRLLHTMCTNQK
jgi:hypothetical protein